MRRLLFLLFTVLLPMQFAWGAVAAYCQHEADPASHHFGHHEHVHKVDTVKKSDGGSTQDNDCGTCHAASLPALTGAAEAEAPVLLRQPPLRAVAHRPHAPPERTPERPQWTRLA